MSLTVKVYFDKVGLKQPEIRRFPIDQDVATNMQYLTTKLHYIFPDLTKTKYCTCWKGKV